jgi:GTP-binding protein EngB required for normal cell division
MNPNGRTLVVAIAGGTGSGKSSLLNALAGREISPTGAIRPTTDRPRAWIPERPHPELAALLDELEVTERVSQGRFSHLAVIDLPDFDSFRSDHRSTVTWLLARVDAVIWVTDPEKYNDRVMHREFIEVFRRYQDQFVFVLNQVDLLSPSDAQGLAADWRQVLAADGIHDPEVVATAADPAQGPQVGIGQLRSHLEARLDAKKAVMRKLSADLLEAADRLALMTGVTPGRGLGFDGTWARARRSAAVSLLIVRSPEVDARTGRQVATRTARRPRSTGSESNVTSDDHVAAVASATTQLSAFVADLSLAAGGAWGARIRREFPRPRIEATCRAAHAAVPPGSLGIRPRAAWRAAGLGQWILLVAAAVFLVVGGMTAGWVWVATAGASGFAVVGLEVWLRHSARAVGREGTRAVDAAREAIATRLDAEMGIPLRGLVRERAELAALLAELGVRSARVRPG